MPTKHKVPAIPEAGASGEPIRAFRESLSMSQEEFAQAVGVTRVAVVHWERGHSKSGKRGRSEPGGSAYIGMAKLAAEKDDSARALYFWEKAGVDLSTLRSLNSAISKTLKEFERRQQHAAASSDVRIPVLKNATHVRQPALAAEDEVASWLSLPAGLLPNPAFTCGLRVSDDFMELFRQNDVVMVDASFWVEAPTGGDQVVDGLLGKIVAVYHKASGSLCIRRLIGGGTEGPINICTDKALELMPLLQRFSKVKLRKWNPEYPEVVKKGWLVNIRADPDWVIVGPVIAWVSAGRPSQSGGKKK
jgi:transcriptional regulator with XRE-family HTH domain